MNTVYSAGLAAAGVGLAAFAASFFVVPDTTSFDQQIADLDKSITLLGGS
ncbi:MAG: hypothetical protein WCG80_04415 [Spirochaetales bacterium]